MNEESVFGKEVISRFVFSDNFVPKVSYGNEINRWKNLPKVALRECVSR